MIPNSFVNDLLDRVDIANLIESAVPLQRAGSEYKACCPFHDEKTPSFYVVPDKRMYHCFGCGVSGNAVGWVMAYDGLGFVDAVKLLAGRMGLEIPDDGSGFKKRRQDGPAREDLYAVHTRLTHWYRQNLLGPGGATARQYLAERGISDEIQERFQVGYAPDSFHAVVDWGRAHNYSADLMLRAGVLTSKEGSRSPYDRWRDRIMFPISDERRRVVAFSGRVLSSEAKGGKYVNSPETDIFKKGRILYGIGQARDGIRKQGCTLLCDGQLDVIACHQAGFDHAVAPQGTAFTTEQARLLGRFAPDLLLAFDSDRAGTEATVKAADSFLAASLTARVVRLGDGEDPDSLIKKDGPAALAARIQQAQDYFAFLIDYLSTQHDATHPEGKRRIAETYLNVVRQLPSEITRSEYVQLLSNRLDLATEAVRDELHQINDKQQTQAQSRTRRRLINTAPAVVPEQNRLSSEESILFDVALHHGRYAWRMVEDLESGDLPNSQAGHALRALLARSALGEWSAGVRDIAVQANELPPSLSAVIVRSQFPADCPDDVVGNAYQRCVLGLREVRLRERSATEQDPKTQLEINKKRAEIAYELKTMRRSFRGQ